MRGARAGRAGGIALALALAAAAIAVAGPGPATAVKPRPITGTDRGERLVGTRWRDTIRGLGGDDTLIGRAGDDRLFGGRGFDTIRGGRGRDRLVGQGDGALLAGGPGRDQFNMRDGRRLQGAGRDVIRARDGTPDQINCGRGPSDVAYVDRVEDGVYDCERIVTPDGTIETSRVR